MPISPILTPFDHFQIRPTFAVTPNLILEPCLKREAMHDDDDNGEDDDDGDFDWSHTNATNSAKVDFSDCMEGSSPLKRANLCPRSCLNIELKHLETKARHHTIS